VVARRRAPALGAALTGSLLVAALLLVPGQALRGIECATGPAIERLAKLPKDAVIAGDPADLECLPGTARRAVVISTQLAPSYEVDYFLEARARIFDMLRAYYGPSADAISALRERYGATHLWVNHATLAKELSARPLRWRASRVPYGLFVRRLVRRADPATLDLPRACRSYANGPDEIYDIACLSAR
jgi:hypothetical protein